MHFSNATDLIEYSSVHCEKPVAISNHGEKAVLVFRFEDNDKAIAALSAAGIDVLAFADILTDAK